MKLETIQEIIQCLGDERVLFHYYKDRYSAWLLSEYAAETSISEARAGQFAPLLQKPLIKTLIGDAGDGRLHADTLAGYWPSHTDAFVLGLTFWGGKHGSRWNQTSRPGYNLVLQLNVSGVVMQRLRQFLGSEMGYFNSPWHPSRQPDDARYRETLAWARIDLDLAADEALIEEIQSDWVRYAAYAITRGVWVDGESVSPERVNDLIGDQLRSLNRVWSEAMLTAALWFLRREIGVSRIYYHEYVSGNHLKRLAQAQPPRSLYSQVPKAFCMERTGEVPKFLWQDRKLRKHIRASPEPISFFRLDSKSIQ